MFAESQFSTGLCTGIVTDLPSYGKKERRFISEVESIAAVVNDSKSGGVTTVTTIDMSGGVTTVTTIASLVVRPL
jgi:hypothetical protein